MDSIPVIATIRELIERESDVIRSLKPNVTQEEALRALRGTGVFSFLRHARSGPLRRIADAYVPFRLYRVCYTMNKETVQRIFAMDAVNGSLDLFEFRTAPRQEELVDVQTRNRMSDFLSEEEAQRILREKILRIIFQQGFFKLRETSLEIEALPGLIHLPYWLGFYGASDRLRCRALDAVRRRIEGAKASAFFEQWLAA